MNMPPRFGNTLPPDAPVLTPALTEKWRAELRTMKDQRDKLDFQIVTLEQKVAAAELLVSDFAQTLRNETSAAVEPANEPEQRGRAPGTVNITSVIESIINRVGNEHLSEGFEPKDIVHVIHNDPLIDPGVKETHSNYPYTVIKRMIKDGRLERRDTKYFLTAKGIAQPAKSRLPKARLSNPGFKQVPLTKEEKIRHEVKDVLERADGPLHRSDIARYLREIGVFNETDPTQYVSIYLSRWKEFVADGRGYYTLHPELKNEGDA